MLDYRNPENDRISLIKRNIYRKTVIFNKFIKISIVYDKFIKLDDK